MNTNVSVSQLWNLAKSLSPANKRWLADRLYEAAREEALVPYTEEELNARIDESLEDIRAGRTLASEEVHRRMKEYRYKPVGGIITDMYFICRSIVRLCGRISPLLSRDISQRYLRPCPKISLSWPEDISARGFHTPINSANG